jgi:hypothetical protein
MILNVNRDHFPKQSQQIGLCNSEVWPGGLRRRSWPLGYWYRGLQGRGTDVCLCVSVCSLPAARYLSCRALQASSHSEQPVCVVLCRWKSLRRSDHSSKGVLPSVLIRLLNLRCEAAKVLLTRIVEPMMMMMMMMNGVVWCSLWGTDWTLKQYQDELRLQSLKRCFSCISYENRLSCY